MINEVTAATTFLTLHLTRIVPEEVSSKFRDVLAKRLQEKFVSHWDVKRPLRGNGYRSISCHYGRLDRVITESAEECSIDASLLVVALPPDFVMWIDPFCVSYRARESGESIVIWEDRAALESLGCTNDPASDVANLVNSPPSPTIERKGNGDNNYIEGNFESKENSEAKSEKEPNSAHNGDQSATTRENCKGNKNKGREENCISSSSPAITAIMVV